MWNMNCDYLTLSNGLLDFNADLSSLFSIFFDKNKFPRPQSVYSHFSFTNPASFFYDFTTNTFTTINILRFLRRNPFSKFKFSHFWFRNVRVTVLYRHFLKDSFDLSFPKTFISSLVQLKTFKLIEFQSLSGAFKSLFKSINFIAELDDKVTSFISAVQDSASPFFYSFSSFVVSVTRFLAELSEGFNLKNIVFNFIQMILPLHQLWKNIGDVKEKYQRNLEFQSFEILAVINSLIGIPNNLHSLLLKLYKIADEVNNPILSIYNLIIDIFCAILLFAVNCAEKIFPNSPFAVNFRFFYEHVAYSSEVRLHTDRLTHFLTNFVKDQSQLHSSVFRNEAASLYARLLSCTNFQKALRSANSRSLVSMWVELKNIIKSIEGYSSASRTTPAFVVLEGPPGCGKSTCLGQITDYLSRVHTPQRSIYSHVWKTNMEGKDWYDDYSGQTTMVLDDVGQGGMGQWAKTMNFISNVKLPLDCAEADKKNTKFFVSSSVICTTNNITGNLVVTPSDGIADLNALRRRPIVLKFLPPVINPDNSRTFTVNAMFFDFLSNNPVWKNGFPTDFNNFLILKNKTIPATLTGKLEDISAWICAITLCAEDANSSQSVHTNCTFSSADVGKFYTQSAQFNKFKNIFKPSYKVTYKKESQKVGLIKTVEPTNYKYVVYPDLLDNEENSNLVDVFLNSISSISLNVLSSILSIKNKFLYVFENLNIAPNIASFIIYLFDIFYSAKSWASKLLDCTTNLIKEHPYISAFISSFFLIFSTGFIYLSYRLLNRSPNVVENQTACAKYLSSGGSSNLKGFKTQGLEFPMDDENFGNPEKHCYWILARSTAEEGYRKSVATFSGRRALVSRHSVFGCTTISAYKTEDDLNRGRTMLDECPFSIIYDCPSTDICVIELSIATHNLFKKANILFHSGLESQTSAVKSAVFVTPEQSLNYSNKKLRTNDVSFSVACDIYKKDIEFGPETGVLHEVAFKGLCGAVLFSPTHGFLGTHVAGGYDGQTIIENYRGFIAISTSQERKKISELMLDCDEGLVLEPIDGSAMRVRYVKGEISPKKPLKQSRLYETGAPFMEPQVCKDKVVPMMRDSDGKSLLKTIVSPNFNNTGHVCPLALNFGAKVLEQYVTKFKVISWKDVILGNEDLAPLRKDSVNGYGYDTDKTAYIDFENGTLDKAFELYLDDFEKRLRTGDVKMTEMLAYHALKDEPRPNGKVPRTFAVMPLHMTLLFKKYFGSLMAYIKNNRHTNGIAIGLNPYKEWSKVHANLTSGGKFIMDGDFGRWDRSLIASFLDTVFSVLKKFFAGTKEQHKTLKSLCDSLVRMFVLVDDELFLITHGLQSGCWLTALLNSLINKLISACSFYYSYKPKGKHPSDSERLIQFNRIVEYFLGDDRISGVPPDLAEYYNLRTLKPFVESLGMEITDGKKRPINHDFVDMKDASFLKRSFVVSNNVNISPISAPLSLDTIGNLFKFCDSSKDFNVVMSDRSIIFQIEKYLHPKNELLEEFESAVKSWFEDNDLVWKEMPEHRIEQILNDKDGYSNMQMLGNKFFEY